MVKRLSVLFLYVSFSYNALFSAIYYVAPNGNDNNSGTMVMPWKSIGKANQVLKAGDKVLIREGTYSDQIAPNNSGSAENARISYQAYPGENPVIDFGEYITGWTKHAGTEGVDAVYKAKSDKKYNRIAVDDFAKEGRHTIPWNKENGNRQLGKKELFLITHPGEFYNKGGFIYLRTSDGRPPGKVRGLVKMAILVDGKKFISIEGLRIINVNGFMIPGYANLFNCII